MHQPHYYILRPLCYLLCVNKCVTHVSFSLRLYLIVPIILLTILFAIFFKWQKKFLSLKKKKDIYLMGRQMERRESQADSRLSTEPHARLSFTKLGSWLEFNQPRVQRLANQATQAPLK